MNKKQMQISVCRALLDIDKRCCGGFLNENEFAVTTDGVTAYVFFKDECIFDIEKVKKVDFTKFFAEDENDKEMKSTNELFMQHGKMLEKYITETAEIYVDTDVAKNFKGFRYFASNAQSRILVKNDFGMVVGLFLPVRFYKAGE